ncbi:MAG: pyruvate kinase [Gammaproteobacteria bacterium]|nr:pyruvate kinase [Gammaproteobacteria bacterium]
MPRRTKIIATLGPATDRPGVLERCIAAGVDLVRLNFSHGGVADHEHRIHQVREYAAKYQREVGILADLQGPKIRVSTFEEGSVILEKGEAFILDASLPEKKGNVHTVGVDYKNLPRDVKPEDVLMLDDGRIVLKVLKIEGPRIHCCVEGGGVLSNNKGINRLGGGLSAESLTEKDINDLKVATKLGVDYIAISFPRSADDILYAKKLIEQENSKAGVIAKIERAEAVKVIDEIIKVSCAVMVARGDLGVEIGDAELPIVQKHIIQRARTLDKAVITATQMMESMIENSIPTRAEVFDVANAVLDGTDAVMLSAETASGEHPDKVIEAMARICIGAEKQRISQISRHRVECHFTRVDEVIAMSAMYAANHFDVKAIVALTESGSTPLWMSRIRSGIPIYGLTRHVETQRRMTLFRGVYPVHFDPLDAKTVELYGMVLEHLKKQGIVHEGDWVIITRGDSLGVHGQTNTMKILQVTK